MAVDIYILFKTWRLQPILLSVLLQRIQIVHTFDVHRKDQIFRTCLFHINLNTKSHAIYLTDVISYIHRTSFKAQFCSHDFFELPICEEWYGYVFKTDDVIFVALGLLWSWARVMLIVRIRGWNSMKEAV